MVDVNNSHVTPCSELIYLTKRVDKMEDTLTSVNTRVINIDKGLLITERLLNKMEVALDLNTKAVISIEKTMISMQGDIKNNASINMRIEKEVGQIKEKFEEAEEKAKLDLRVILKRFIDNKITWLIGGGISLVALLEILSRVDWENLLKVVGK